MINTLNTLACLTCIRTTVSTERTHVHKKSQSQDYNQNRRDSVNTGSKV